MERFHTKLGSIEAIAEDAWSEDSENKATVDIDALGNVEVIAVDGGKAEVEAIAKDGDENSAGVDITADGDVKVKADCKGEPSEAEIMALAKDAYTGSNTAGVDIAAGVGIFQTSKKVSDVLEPKAQIGVSKQEFKDIFGKATAAELKA